MSRRDIEKLLGGYATGTLTEAERESLFQAALEDQEIFNALLGEEPLRETLADPAARARLLAALDEPAPAWRALLMRWMWGHAVGVAAVSCFLAVGGYVAWQSRHSAPPKTVLVAEMKPFSIDVTADEEPQTARPTRPFDTSSLVKPEQRKPEMPPLPAPPAMQPLRRASVRLIPSELNGMQLSQLPPYRPELVASQFLPREVTGAAAAEAITMEAQGSSPAYYRASPPGGSNSVQIVAGRADFVAPQNESVQVAGMAGAIGGAAPRVGISFAVLRKAASGDFAPAEGTEFAAGETVRLRITANETGYVTVLPEGAQQPLLATRVAQLSTVVTPDIQSAVAASLRVQISFTPASSALSAAPALRAADMSAPEAEGDRKDHAKSAAATDTPAAPLTYSITLRWK